MMGRPRVFLLLFLTRTICYLSLFVISVVVLAEISVQPARQSLNYLKIFIYSHVSFGASESFVTNFRYSLLWFEADHLQI